MATLAETERRFTAGMDPSARAKRLYSALEDTVAELHRMAKSCRPDADATRELLELEAERVEQARQLLRILETEQFRQRETIKHYLYGHGSRDSLRTVSGSWNNDPSPPIPEPKSPKAEGGEP